MPESFSRNFVRRFFFSCPARRAAGFGSDVVAAPETPSGLPVVVVVAAGADDFVVVVAAAAAAARAPWSP